jgi:hypothetical protein
MIKETQPMRRTLLLGIALLLLPIASGADTFDDGGTHDVDYALFGISFVRQSLGGTPTTVNMIAGSDAGEIEVEDSSVLNVFPGADVGQPDYLFTSSGVICGGTIRQLDLAISPSSPSVEVNGGSFANGPSQPVRMAGGTLVIQGGSFENTAALATKVALSLGGGVAEFRGGTVVDGAVSIGPTMSATISGGDLGSDGITSVSGGTLTLIGTSFNLPFGPVADGVIFNGSLIGTLADGSPIATNLLKSAGSDVFLVEGTQGPLTSTVCDIGPAVPALPAWALGLTLTVLAATGAALQRRLRRIT